VRRHRAHLRRRGSVHLTARLDALELSHSHHANAARRHTELDDFVQFPGEADVLLWSRLFSVRMPAAAENIV
jgi:hypothetical protein